MIGAILYTGNHSSKKLLLQKNKSGGIHKGAMEWHLEQLVVYETLHLAENKTGYFEKIS